MRSNDLTTQDMNQIEESINSYVKKAGIPEYLRENILSYVDDERLTIEYFKDKDWSFIVNLTDCSTRILDSINSDSIGARTLKEYTQVLEKIYGICKEGITKFDEISNQSIEHIISQEMFQDEYELHARAGDLSKYLFFITNDVNHAINWHDYHKASAALSIDTNSKRSMNLLSYCNSTAITISNFYGNDSLKKLHWINEFIDDCDKCAHLGFKLDESHAVNTLKKIKYIAKEYLNETGNDTLFDSWYSLEMKLIDSFSSLDDYEKYHNATLSLISTISKKLYIQTENQKWLDRRHFAKESLAENRELSGDKAAFESYIYLAGDAKDNFELTNNPNWLDRGSMAWFNCSKLLAPYNKKLAAKYSRHVAEVLIQQADFSGDVEYRKLANTHIITARNLAIESGSPNYQYDVDLAVNAKIIYNKTKDLDLKYLPHKHNRIAAEGFLTQKNYFDAAESFEHAGYDSNKLFELTGDVFWYNEALTCFKESLTNFKQFKLAKPKKGGIDKKIRLIKSTIQTLTHPESSDIESEIKPQNLIEVTPQEAPVIFS